MPSRLPTPNEIKAQQEYIQIMNRAQKEYEYDFTDIEFYQKFTKAIHSAYHKKETKTNTKLLIKSFNIVEEMCGGCNAYAETKLIMKYGRANSYGSEFNNYRTDDVVFNLECFYEIFSDF
tara:strand:- start:64 stop:423 length:360 start_codon:yes stop_codon:yes gene_type:complete